MPSPLVLLALGFAAGIALREALLLSWAVCAGICAGAALMLLLGWRRGFVGLPSIAAMVGLGALAAARAHPLAPPELVDGAPWEIRARVQGMPERSLGRTRLLLALDEVVRDGEARAARGLVQLGLPGDPVEPLLPGDRVRARARLLPPRGFHEPDSPDPERRQAERGVIAVGGLATPASLVRLLDGAGAARAGPATGLLRAVADLRARLLALVARHLQGERRALVESLVLGERGGISRELDEAFRRAGVTHVLSVSGLHLAIAGFLAYVGLRRLLLRIPSLARRTSVRRVAALAALPATGLYTLLTGAAVATVRSCLATWVVLLGVAAERPATAAGALSVAALLLLALSPLALFDPSFQLSFAAAFGTVLIGGPLARALLGGRLEGPGLLERAARAVVRLVAASLAALVATAPITAWYFAQVAPAGLVSNVVVVPLAELWVLPVGLAGCAAAAVERVAAVLLHGAGLGAGGMAALARFFAAHAPEGRVPAPTALEALLYYGALAAALLAAQPRRRWAALRVGAALVVALAAAIGWRAAGPRLWPSLRVTFLDVGQGDSALVELPDGRALLIDGGGSFDPRFDPGEQVLVPWLRRRGVGRLDAVVLTHPHPDHAGGLASVVAAFPVGEVWTNGEAPALPALERLLAVAAARGVPVVRPHALDGPARVEVLHPRVGGEVRVPAGFSENDGSIVLRVVYGRQAVLLTGDIERRAEARLGAAGDDLGAAVLKGPHHCSRTSSSQALLDRVRPRLVVCSVGAGNLWHFPAAEVVERAERGGARVLRTDRDGAVSVRIDREDPEGRGGAIRYATARGGDRFHRLE